MCHQYIRHRPTVGTQQLGRDIRYPFIPKSGRKKAAHYRRPCFDKHFIAALLCQLGQYPKYVSGSIWQMQLLDMRTARQLGIAIALLMN